MEQVDRVAQIGQWNQESSTENCIDPSGVTKMTGEDQPGDDQGEQAAMNSAVEQVIEWPIPGLKQVYGK